MDDVEAESNKDQAIEQANKSVKRHKRLAKFWFGQTIPVCVSYFVLPTDLWQSIMLVYLAVVSIYANGATHLSAAAGFESKSAGLENP